MLAQGGSTQRASTSCVSSSYTYDFCFPAGYDLDKRGQCLLVTHLEIERKERKIVSFSRNVKHKYKLLSLVKKAIRNDETETEKMEIHEIYERTK